MKRITSIIGLLIIMGVLFSLPSTALAADWKTNLIEKSVKPELVTKDKLVRFKVDEPAIDKWKFSIGAVTGMTTDQEGYYRASMVVDSPDGPAFFEMLMPDTVWYEVVRINIKDMCDEDGNPIEDEIVNMARFKYYLGGSDNFAGLIIQDDDDTSIGFNYDPSHWSEALGWFDVSLLSREGRQWLACFDAFTDFTAGYGIEAHVLYYLDQDFKRQKIDGRVNAWHNLYPDGRLWLEAGYENRIDKGFWYFGIGGKT